MRWTATYSVRRSLRDRRNRLNRKEAAARGRAVCCLLAAVAAAFLPPNLVQTGVYFLPIFYRPAETRQHASANQNG
jgi:hypothetical protein